MPTNLPPDYFNVEKRFREAQTTEEKIALLEEMISIVPKHKGTDHLRAGLRRQLSKLKEESGSRKKTSGHQTSYYVAREGAGQICVIGPTNVGKSSLVSALTHAQPDISAAPYTTRRPIPGMMPIENIQVQLIDTPSLDRDFVEPGLFDLIRRVDLVLLILDLQDDPIKQLDDALQLLEEHRIVPSFSGKDLQTEKRMVFLPFIILVNKCDDESTDELYEICCELLARDWPMIPISAKTGRNFSILKEKVYQELGIIRVYAKPPGKEADLEKPFVLKKGSTIVDLAEKIHRDFLEQLKSARVWGSSMFDGQHVQRDYVLQDGDIVELRI